jgi:predicted transcriptional regulator
MAKMTIFLEPDLHKALRHLAVDRDTSFQKLAVQALQEFLERQQISVQRQPSRRKG